MSDMERTAANANGVASPRASTSASTIHDIGYQRYTGRVDGPRAAWRALFAHGVRTMFGLGRRARFKAIPAFVLLFTLIPVLGMLTVVGASAGAVPVRYAALIGPQLVLYALFAAAQVPELFSRDQQQHVLPLLFTRQLTRDSYALVRLASVLASIFFVVALPPLLLYLGEYGNATDPTAAFERMGGQIGPVLVTSITATAVFGTVAALIASLTPRRAYATAAVIGLFLATAAAGAAASDLAGQGSHIADFIDPLRALRTQAQLLFGETTRAMEVNPPLSVQTYTLYLASLSAVCALGLIVRLRRVNA